MEHQRRDLLKKAAIGGAVAWTAPTVLSGVAAAGLPSPQPGNCAFATTVVAGANCEAMTVFFTLTQGCPQTVVVSVEVNGSTYCPVTSGVQFLGTFDSPTIYTVSVRESCGGKVLDSQVNPLVPDCFVD